jgi:hypothetical protein
MKSKQSWFLASVIERAEHIIKGELIPNRRLLTWTNTLLIRAQSLSEAYDKAMEIATRLYPVLFKAVSGNTVQWTVLVLSALKQIEEGLEDGSEIAWNDLGYISI